MFKKQLILLAIMAFSMFSLTGCYFWRTVEPHEFAIRSNDGVSIDEVVGEGRYSNSSWWADIHVIDGQSKTITWRDNELLTYDRQSVGFEVSVTYARSRGLAEVMWTQFRAASTCDESLAELVITRIPRVVKAITSAMTLDQMLERTELQTEIRQALHIELEAIGLRLIDLGVNNIRPSEHYLQLLEQRATIAAEEELAVRRNTVALAEVERERTVAESNIERERVIAEGSVALAEQQLLLEIAETDVALELARRDLLVAQENARIYELSDAMLQIRLATIHADALRNANTIYLPSDNVLNLFGGAIPTTR